MSAPLLPFDVWDQSILQASIPFNNNVRRGEILARALKSASTTAQPASPADYDVYVIPASATGSAWAGFEEGDLAIYDEGWYAFAPIDGLRKYVEDEDANWQYTTGDGWAVEAGGGGGSAAWGGITGTLSAQTDLQAALDAKADETDVTAAFAALAPIASTGDVADLTGFPGGTTNFLREDGTFAAPAGGGGGGLTNWTDALAGSGINATRKVASLTATNAATDVDAAIVPKGAGSFSLRIPDGTAAGGDKRGLYAVCLSLSRASSDQVASGDYSFAAGQNVKANNQDCVAVGNGAQATGVGASAHGRDVTASGDNAIAMGRSCTATQQSAVAIGRFTDATGQYAVGLGYNADASANFAHAQGQAVAANE